MFTRYNGVTGQWEKPGQEEVMTWEDIEGHKPCELCWKQARDFGYHVWPDAPGKIHESQIVRCACGRRLDVKPQTA